MVTGSPLLTNFASCASCFGLCIRLWLPRAAGVANSRGGWHILQIFGIASASLTKVWLKVKRSGDEYLKAFDQGYQRFGSHDTTIL